MKPPIGTSFRSLRACERASRGEAPALLLFFVGACLSLRKCAKRINKTNHKAKRGLQPKAEAKAEAQAQAEAEAETEADAKGRGRGKGSRDSASRTGDMKQTKFYTIRIR